MTLDKAIEILDEIKNGITLSLLPGEKAAIRLGIEALKREKTWRDNPRRGFPPLLAGETEE